MAKERVRWLARVKAERELAESMLYVLHVVRGNELDNSHPSRDIGSLPDRASGALPPDQSHVADFSESSLTNSQRAYVHK